MLLSLAAYTDGSLATFTDGLLVPYAVGKDDMGEAHKVSLLVISSKVKVNLAKSNKNHEDNDGSESYQ